MKYSSRRLASVFTIIAGFSFSSFASAVAPSVVAKVALFPVGSFDATSKIVQGKGIKTGNKYSAKEIKVPVNSIDTENNLRNKHMKEKLKSKEYPHIIVKDVHAEKGVGTAKMTIMKTTKKVDFTFKELDAKHAEATFKINLPDFKISGINYKGVGVEDTVEIVAIIAYDKK